MRKRSVTVVGGGQAGLLLGIGLQERGHSVRLVQDRDAAALSDGRVMSSQVVFGTAHAIEQSHGLDFWGGDAPKIVGMRIGGGQAEPLGSSPWSFIGRLQRAAQSVDQRVKFPAWLSLYTAAGGLLEIQQATMADLERFALDSELVVVASGKGEIANLFTRDPARSPFSAPRCAVSLAYVTGMHQDDRLPCVSVTMSPFGLLFSIPAWTHVGRCDILLAEGAIGGPLDCCRPEQDADEHVHLLGRLFKRYAPDEAERLSAARPTDARATLCGRITPVVRHPVGALPSGRLVLGLADAVVLNDPIVGQGANNAIKTADLVLNAIERRGDEPFDEPWLRTVGEAAWRRVAASTAWTNMMLAPSRTDEAAMLWPRAATDATLAARLANGFDEPASIMPLWRSATVRAREKPVPGAGPDDAVAVPGSGGS